jgi:hypothetical protein
MAVPISPRTLGVFLACGAILPVAAFFAAMPTQKGKAKTLNIIGVVIGVVAISIIGFELYQNR